MTISQKEHSKTSADLSNNQVFIAYYLNSNSFFVKQSIQDFISRVAERNPNEPEFMQAVTEVAETVIPFIEDNSQIPRTQVT